MTPHVTFFFKLVLCRIIFIKKCEMNDALRTRNWDKIRHPLFFLIGVIHSAALRHGSSLYPPEI